MKKLSKTQIDVLRKLATCSGAFYSPPNVGVTPTMKLISAGLIDFDMDKGKITITPAGREALAEMGEGR